jgi:hypothetical protein
VVVADTGKPAEGVRVTAQATSRARDPGMGDQDFTDAQGNYRLKQLAALEYNVEALLSGDLAGQYTVAALENVSLAPAQKRTGSDLKLVTGSWIVGRVTVQGSDQPVPNVNISVYGPASPQSSALVRGVRTGADGTYKMRVPPGAQYVYYNSPNPPGLNRAAGVEYKRDISVEEGGTVTVNFELAKIPAPELKGVVVDEQGNPVAGANVVMDPRNASPRNDGIAQVTTDDEGKFSIPGVRNGARLSVSKGSLALERPITVSTNRDLKVVIRAIDPATRAPASALVRVQQEDHTPIAGAKARLIVINGSTGLGGETLTTGPEGTVEFKSLSPNGEYAVDFAADGFGRGQIQKLKLEAGKQTETVITLPKADSFIAGIVVDENNIPLPDVEVVSSGGAYGRPQSARSDVAGHFRMNSIVAGDTPSLYVHKGIVNTQPQPVAAGTDNAIVVAKPAAPSTRPSGRAR